MNTQAGGEIYELLRKHGMRTTSARVHILEVLRSNRQTVYFAEQMFLELSTRGVGVSLGTIYRVLQELEHVGVVVREWRVVDNIGKSMFMLAPSVQPPSSYRAVCRVCRRDIDIADRQLIEGLQRQAKTSAFDVALSSMSIEVTCNSCA